MVGSATRFGLSADVRATRRILAPPMSAFIDSLPALLQDVHDRFVNLGDGAVADYIPELAKADPDLFAVAACTVDGVVHSTGDDRHRFSLQSITKPFLYGAALARFGHEFVDAKVGVEPTGEAFNSMIGLTEGANRAHNPMANAGAIAVSSMFAGGTRAERVDAVLSVFRGFMGRDDVVVDSPIHLSERESGYRNRAIAHLMHYLGILEHEVDEVLDLYFMGCSVLATCGDLAVMAATLAGGGVNPITGKTVLDAETVRDTLSVMATCGMYDQAGAFAVEVGLPAKSGVSGGILAVLPDHVGLAVFSPRLDEIGNSVRGTACLRALSESMSLHLFEPMPAARPRCHRPVSEWRDALDAAYAQCSSIAGGAVTTYSPPLAAADPDALGMAVCTIAGEELDVGAADRMFSLQAAANPFTYGLVLEAHGFEAVDAIVGVEPSGNPFHAIRFDPRTRRPHNAMGNAGTLAVASLLPGRDPADRLSRLMRGMGRYAGVERLDADVTVLAGEQESGERNRAIAWLLRNFDLIHDVMGPLELCFHQHSFMVSCRTLARMGATIANRGQNPITGETVIGPDAARRVMTVMSTCGMHDASGLFAFRVGIPAKSGISGCIVAGVPGRAGIAVWSPPVDGQGASVRGVAALESISRALALSVFAPDAPG